MFKNNTQYTTGSPTGYSISSSNFDKIGQASGLASNGYGTEIIVYTNSQAANNTGINTNINTFYSIYPVPPVVSDPDAQAFVDRVFAAGGSVTSTEANAVNTLTIGLKSNGLWTLMKAIYPMVGGSAAACAQNLKSSSFTATFSGAWTYSANGITGNGSNTYMSTNLTPLTNLSLNSTHISGYLRTTNSSNHMLIGVKDLYIANYGFATVNNTDQSATNTAGQVGFFINSRIISNQYKQYKNNTILSTIISPTFILYSAPIFVGAWNDNGTTKNYVNGQIAFASIGDGLNDTQESNFYTAIQAFQTSLSRNV